MVVVVVVVVVLVLEGEFRRGERKDCVRKSIGIE